MNIIWSNKNWHYLHHKVIKAFYYCKYQRQRHRQSSSHLDLATEVGPNLESRNSKPITDSTGGVLDPYSKRMATVTFLWKSVTCLHPGLALLHLYTNAKSGCFLFSIEGHFCSSLRTLLGLINILFAVYEMDGSFQHVHYFWCPFQTHINCIFYNASVWNGCARILLCGNNNDVWMSVCMDAHINHIHNIFWTK